MSLLVFKPEGIFCPPANVYIDPWRKVERALITHAHADHARWGQRHYVAQEHNEQVLRARLGKDISLQTVAYGESISINGVRFSWHPAGHIPGSAQIRVEHRGEIWVASGDYKVENDGLTPAFEPVPCHTFITECTFGMPIYRWQPQSVAFAAINQWWMEAAAAGQNCVLFGYSLGKAQRLLSGIDPSIGPIFVHPSIAQMNEALAAVGFQLPATLPLSSYNRKLHGTGVLVLAPPGAADGHWQKKLEPYTDATASGWVQVRGNRRRQSLDRGFVISDHADYPGLLQAISATGAEKVICTHGFTALFSRQLREMGLDAQEEHTLFMGEGGAAAQEETE
ncbi:MAG: ligase-associated DNA damage response exonuclease [Sphingobacteriaceae bacterium]|nr:ligase-associated DNA damage response exonuclease [Sphingobacteriaceae bacterium]